ncbi:MAG: tRNA 2-thiouridine(34) synthase MnmA [Calditrichia bacterium]
MNLDKNKVVVAMSGGVDSSVAAILLQKNGYDVIGMTMKLWNFLEVGGNVNQESGCCSIDSFNDARNICVSHHIPYYLVNFSQQFHKDVIENFIREYLNGRTPNPCVLCNTKIKWETFLNKAAELGAHYMATGHYARVKFNENTGRYELHRGKDDNKDQSYALWGLKQESLARTLFPLGELTKPEVRQLADEYGLVTAKKPESQEICFVQDNNYGRFLKEQVDGLEQKVKDGPIITVDGKLVGRHKGYPFYTIGQRRGLGVSFSRPMYVVEIIPESNTIVIGDKEDLEVPGLIATGINLIKYDRITDLLRARIKIRYNDDGAMGTVRQTDDDTLEIMFDEPRRAVTPGQSVVFYGGDEVIGGGIIERKVISVKKAN